MVWSEPLQILAPKFGISDVALAKKCRKAGIPVPSRGYWAKVASGKNVIQQKLEPRFPGWSDEVVFGKENNYFHYDKDILNSPLPDPPKFDEELASVKERIVKMVGKVACPKTITNPHDLLPLGIPV